KKQRRFYSGKKKRHTLKQQIVADARSRRILCTAGTQGRRHDFKLLLQSGVRFPKGMWTLADSGYQGLQELTGNALLPFKGSKHHPLTPQQKAYNRMLASQRIVIENIIRFLKRFHIIADRYQPTKTIRTPIQSHRSHLQSGTYAM